MPTAFSRPEDSSSQRVVTLWYISTENPGSVLELQPKADRGFGRKFLAQLNPSWPVTVIGQFPLNRSALTDASEFYIAAYPGVTVIQTVLDVAATLSTLPLEYRTWVEAPVVCAFAFGPQDFAGMARWENGTLTRSLCARPDTLIEDIGLPEPFEQEFWSGHVPHPDGGIYLPFFPQDMVHAAQSAWLGIDISPTGPDIDVVAYAIDGRPAPKVPQLENTTSEPPRVEDVPAYDDYESYSPSSLNDAQLYRMARKVRLTAEHFSNTITRKMDHVKNDPSRKKQSPRLSQDSGNQFPGP